MATRNPGQLAPGPDDLTNKYSTYQFEAQMAQPRDMRDRVRRDRQELRAFEGLDDQATYALPFVQAVSDSYTGASHRDVEVKIAGQAEGRSLLASGQAVPSWNRVPEVLAEMFEGASGDPGQPHPPQFTMRPGADSRALAPTFPLQVGERPGQVFVTKIAENTSRLRPNEARVDD